MTAVISPTAGAAGFFSRGLRVKGQSSPEEVACGVFVSLGAMRASLTFERRLGDAILRRCVTTGFAAVGGVPGVDLNQRAPSIFRFGAQY